MGVDEAAAAIASLDSAMQTLLFKLGLVLFVIGLLTGFAIPALKNPRMGLTSHLEGVLNGMFLALLGLLWPHVHLPHAWGVTAVVLIMYSAFANWLGTLLAAAWGAGRKLAPIAAGDHEASKVKEIVLFPGGVTVVCGRDRRRYHHRRTLTPADRPLVARAGPGNPHAPAHTWRRRQIRRRGRKALWRWRIGSFINALTLITLVEGHVIVGVAGVHVPRHRVMNVVLGQVE